MIVCVYIYSLHFINVYKMCVNYGNKNTVAQHLFQCKNASCMNRPADHHQSRWGSRCYNPLKPDSPSSTSATKQPHLSPRNQSRVIQTFPPLKSLRHSHVCCSSSMQTVGVYHYREPLREHACPCNHGHVCQTCNGICVR